ESADTMGAHRRLVRGDLLLKREEADELVDDRDDVQAGGEVARDDEPQRVALPQVIALVQKHRAKLGDVQPVDQRGRETDPRAQEPVAERKWPAVGDDVDLAAELAAR